MTGAVRSVSDRELESVIERFAEHLAFERRASAHTVSAYRRDLAALAAFLREKLEREPRLSDVTRITLRGWLGKLAEGLAPASIARKLSSVRALYVFLGRLGEVRENPGVADSVAQADPRLAAGAPARRRRPK